MQLGMSAKCRKRTSRASYSITRSTRNRMDGGIVRPKADMGEQAARLLFRNYLRAIKQSRAYRHMERGVEMGKSVPGRLM